MRTNTFVAAITAGLMAAILSSVAIAKDTNRPQGSGSLSPSIRFEHCMLDGGKTAQNKSVVACCHGGICTICGKKTQICVTRKQGRARVIDLVRRPSAHTPGGAAAPKGAVQGSKGVRDHRTKRTVRVQGNRVRLNRGDRVVRQTGGRVTVHRRAGERSGRVGRGVTGTYSCQCGAGIAGTCTLTQGVNELRCNKKSGDTCKGTCVMQTTTSGVMKR
jgi:hypothetical protein